jgi:FliG C-terminal domain
MLVSPQILSRPRCHIPIWGYTAHMATTYDQNDLLQMAPADLQRALLDVPDELLVQALSAAREDVRGKLLGNLSRRRKSDVMHKAAQLESSGEMTARSAAAALHNLMRKVFEVSSPEEDATDAAATTANVKERKRAADRPADEREINAAPDLTEASFNHLREARSVVSSFEGISACSRHLKTCRQGRSGAVLLKSWLGKKPVLSREKVYAAICAQDNATEER